MLNLHSWGWVSSANGSVVSNCIQSMVRHQCVLNRICTRVLICAHPFKWERGGLKKPSLTFQADKHRGLHPGANASNQRRMRLSPAGKKKLTYISPFLENWKEATHASRRRLLKCSGAYQNTFSFQWHQAHSLCLPSFPSQAYYKIS